MRRTIRLIVVLFIGACLFAVSSTNGQTLDPTHTVAYFTDYTDANTRLLRLNFKSGQISVVSEILGADYAFSNDRQKVAFWDSEHLWLSDLSVWNPILLNVDTDLKIEQVTWTPDDSRILLADSREASPTHAYNLHNRRLEDWAWDACQTPVQNVTTLDLAALCSAENGWSNLLTWDGNIDALSTHSYRPIDLIDTKWTTGARIEWKNNGETIAYWRSFSSEAPIPWPYVGAPGFIDILSQSSPATIHLITTRSDFGSHFALSPDGTKLAFMLDTGGGYDHGLDIFDTATGQRLWERSLLFHSTSVNDLVWSPDGEMLTILKFDHPTNYVSLVNLADASMEDYAISENYVRNIAMVDVNNKES